MPGATLPSFGYAQVRESGTGEPGPVKSQHLTAELISDSGTIAPGGKGTSATIDTRNLGLLLINCFDSGV